MVAVVVVVQVAAGVAVEQVLRRRISAGCACLCDVPTVWLCWEAPKENEAAGTARRA